MIDHLFGHAAIDANILTCDETSLIATKIVQSSTLFAMTLDWHSQCLQKQLGALGYPIGIILDNGQALANDDLSNLFPKFTVCLSFFGNELLTAKFA